jgi:8-oxo-dGTP pyrophosphatase MutT (NUDIX family)
MNREKSKVSTGGVVINSKKQVAVVSQHGNSWSLPKGHVDPGEDEIEAAKREIYEEAGIALDKLKVVKYLGEYQRYRIGKDPKVDDKTSLKTIKIYLFKTNQKNLNPVDPANPEARWVEIDDVSALLTHSKDKEFFEKVKKMIAC